MCVRSTINDNEVSDDTFESEGGGIYSDGANAVTTVTDSTDQRQPCHERREQRDRRSDRRVRRLAHRAQRHVRRQHRGPRGRSAPAGLAARRYIDSARVGDDLQLDHRRTWARSWCFGASFTRDHNVVDDSSCGTPVRNPLIGPLAGQRRRHEHARDRARTSPRGGRRRQLQWRRPAWPAPPPRVRRRRVRVRRARRRRPAAVASRRRHRRTRSCPTRCRTRTSTRCRRPARSRSSCPARPGSSPMDEDQQIPLGTIVDVINGRVTIVSSATDLQRRVLRRHLQARADQGEEADHGPDPGPELTGLARRRARPVPPPRRRRSRSAGSGATARASSRPRASTAPPPWSAPSGWSRTRCTSTLTRVVRGQGLGARLRQEEERSSSRPARSTWRRRRSMQVGSSALAVIALALLVACPRAASAGRDRHDRRSGRPTTSVHCRRPAARCARRSCTRRRARSSLVPAGTYDADPDELLVSHDLTIRGAGARTTTIRSADALQRRSGHERRRHGSRSTVRDVRITGGRRPGPAGRRHQRARSADADARATAPVVDNTARSRRRDRQQPVTLDTHRASLLARNHAVGDESRRRSAAGSSTDFGTADACVNTTVSGNTAVGRLRRGPGRRHLLVGATWT